MSKFQKPACVILAHIAGEGPDFANDVELGAARSGRCRSGTVQPVLTPAIQINLTANMVALREVVRRAVAG